jgi:hypothetical protein
MGGEALRKLIQYNVPQMPPTQELLLPKFDGGVCYRMESQLRDNQSPYMLNILTDGQGEPGKRPGQRTPLRN